SWAIRSATASTASWAPSPSAAITTVSPCFAPSVIRLSTLAACTGVPPSLAMVTGTDWAAAVLATSAAGRACRPILLATVTVRSAMSSSLLCRVVVRRGGAGVGRGLGGLAAVLVLLPAGGAQVPLGDHPAEQQVVDHRVDEADRDEQPGL